MIASIIGSIEIKNNLDIVYLDYRMNDKWDTELPLLFIRNTGTWILILISFVPISLLVSLEYIKFWQSLFMTYEYRMYDEE